MSRSPAFTLIEMVLAVFILLLLLGLAVPSLNGVLADKRLHRSLDRFNELVREAREHSIAEHRAFLITWDRNDIVLRPAAYLPQEERKPLDSMAVASGEKWQLDFPAALSKQVAPAWIFWESGVCEPARVKYAGSNGSWTASYSGLSGLPEISNYATR